jgi:lipopolysaccharide biosynthesis glycosyltransferase
MLLPEMYKEYDWIAFFDLDILISADAPSIFSYTNESKAFAAVVDPRDTQKFKNVVVRYWKSPGILNETHQTYFTDRGFPNSPLLRASINGGVFLCSPKKIASKFCDAYYSDFPEVSHEEAIMAYVSQTSDLFYELDERFNKQIIYVIFDDANEEIASLVATTYFKTLRRLHQHVQPPSFAYPASYKKLVKPRLSIREIWVTMRGNVF